MLRRKEYRFFSIISSEQTDGWRLLVLIDRDELCLLAIVFHHNHGITRDGTMLTFCDWDEDERR